MSKSAYGVMTPASDEEKKRNLQIFVGVVGLFLLGSMLMGRGN